MSDDKFVCECEKDFRSACKRLAFYREVEGKKYCVLHCPVKNKEDDFNVELRSKRSSNKCDFRGVYFPSYVDFKAVTFVLGADFSGATFSAAADFGGTTFSTDAYFSGATFSTDANFNKARFSAAADFSGATFSAAADFNKARFSAAADFSEATFSAAAYFNKARFSAAADFSGAKIESYLRFTGTANSPIFAETASLKLQLAQITKPEQMIFHTMRLHPHWFVNVDSRKFEFTNVNWVGFDQASLTWQERAKRKLKRARTAWPEFIKHGIGSEALHNELQAMSKVENHHRLLSNACRQLATNAEDNKRYGDAARFHYASMDARRLEQWRGWNVFTLDWWYWLVSGYGERIPRAAICLLILLLSFGYLFTRVDFETKAAPEAAAVVQEMMPTPPPPKELPLPSFWDGLNYAMSAALFQRPEPKAHSNWAKTCVSLEMVFVPLQAALLALAIRRRFMR